MSTLHLAPGLAAEFEQDITRRAAPSFVPNSNPLFSRGLYAGIRIEANTMFPMEHQCSKCAGSGEGNTATYCTGCGGAGRTRVVGMLDTFLITEPLPKKFQPYFPRGLVSSAPLCRGLT